MFDREGKAESATSIKAPFWSAPVFSRRPADRLLERGNQRRHPGARPGTGHRLPADDRRICTGGVWTPDGRRIVFDWVETGVPNLYWQPGDGSSPMERLTQSENFQFPGSWSPAGQILAFTEVDTATEADYDIRLLHLADRRTAPFLKTQFHRDESQDFAQRELAGVRIQRIGAKARSMSGRSPAPAKSGRFPAMAAAILSGPGTAVSSSIGGFGQTRPGSRSLRSASGPGLSSPPANPDCSSQFRAISRPAWALAGTSLPTAKSSSW